MILMLEQVLAKVLGGQSSLSPVNGEVIEGGILISDVLITSAFVHKMLFGLNLSLT